MQVMYFKLRTAPECSIVSYCWYCNVSVVLVNNVISGREVSVSNVSIIEFCMFGLVLN